MNQRILMSLLIIIGTAVLSGQATYAYFTDVGTNSNNVFSSGTLDLKLSKDGTAYSDSVTAAFGSTALAPGMCLTPAVLHLKNTGSVAGDHIDITVANTNNAFAKYLRLKTLALDGSAITMADANGNGFSDLGDLETAGIANKPFADVGTDHQLTMEVCFDASAGNQQQNQTNQADITITLNQGHS